MKEKTEMKRYVIIGILLITSLMLFAEGTAEVQREQSLLTSQEREDLLFMYEEERLARDVYHALAQRWDMPIFANIARSEQTHMDAIANLFTIYGLEIPALSPGEYAEPEFTQLYQELVESGSQSIEQALAVGAEIERMDIIDLELRMENTTQEQILITYDRLKRGSENHLRAFTR
jgi:hypothetical protein